jgi:hypothetical protein
MAIVTVDVGATCPGGNHCELIVSVDGLESYRRWVEIADVLPGGWPAFNSINDGANSLISGTKAPNLTAWKNLIKSKSVEVPDGLPLGI